MSYARQAYMESMGSIGQRLQASQLREEGMREAELSLQAQQDQLDALSGELPGKVDEDAMGISIGTAGGLKGIVEKGILPRIASKAKAAATAKFNAMLDDSLRAARGRGLGLFNPDELTRFQNARDSLRGMSADARARIMDNVATEREQLNNLIANPEANPTDVLEARRNLMRAVEQQMPTAGPARGEAPVEDPFQPGMTAAARGGEFGEEFEEPEGGAAPLEPPARAPPAEPARPVRVPVGEDPFQPGMAAAARGEEFGEEFPMEARAPTLTERVGGAAQEMAQQVGGAVQRVGGFAQDAADRVSQVVGRAQQIGSDFMQGVRTRITAATAPYQADLAGAAQRQAETGAIINQDHLDALGRLGVNTEGLDSDAVDLGMRGLIGDEATQTVARGLSGAVGGVGAALEALSPIADVIGLGFGVASELQTEAEEKAQAAKQQQLNAAVGMLGAPIQAPGLGTAPVLDTRVDRSPGMMNF